MFSRIDTKFLIQLRNLFNELTGFFITFIDPYGNFIISEVGKRKFCSYLRKLKLNNLCDNSNTFWVKKAVKSKKPFIYKCPFGLTEIVVPIIVENKCIGCVVTGQVRTKNDSFTIPSDVTLLSQEYIMLKKMYNEVPILSCQTINAAKNFINHIINYIFEVDFESL
ncbi:MAG: PocR ligand-binding domain-containing protein, partial [candidate division WOR-3 bacterium]